MTIRRTFLLIGFIVFVVAGYLVTSGILSSEQTYEDIATAAPEGLPEMQIETVVKSLDKPWGLAFLPSGEIIFTERSGAINIVRDDSKIELLKPDDLDARGEGGLLGVAVDPEFSTNRNIYVCYVTSSDVRVVRWNLNDEATELTDATPIITGMPVAPSGRHSGCRPAFGPDNNLWVGTGDAANGTNPQDLQTLGGKVLRVDRDGNGVAGNLPPPSDGRIYSYGHRNIQGIAFAKDKSYIGISAEHGPDIDDEINALASGNFGWNPVPGYNESVPMTDSEMYPDAVTALWSSGKPTVALSGTTFVYGVQWGDMDGRLLSATLKAKKLLVFDVDEDGNLSDEQVLFENEFGRIRSVEQGLDGNLYLTTDNGSNTDRIIRISPQS